MSQSFDRRSFLAGGLALGAGAAMAGLVSDGIAGANTTNGAGRNGISTAKPKRGGSVTFGIDTEETGFNPSSARWDEGGFLYGRTVFDPIAIVTSTGELQPYLAESITSNADFTSFTITMRPNIVFHDGTPLDGKALYANIEAQATSLLTGPAFATNISGATVSGPMAVTITMKNPWAPFPYYLAQAQTGYVAAPSMLSAPNGGTSKPIGTGPFVFQDWVPNSHMTATRNPKYWRSGYPYLDSITYKPIINYSSRADALETGEIDMMHSNSPENLLQFRGNKKYSYYDNSGEVVGQPTVQCVMLNTSAEPFNDHDLRVAMAKCINRAQYAKVIDKGVDGPMEGLFIAGSPYYTKTAYPSYDPAGAASLVKKVVKAGKPVSFSLNSTSDPQTLAAAQFLQQAFQAAGMKVSINIIAQATIINNALAGTYQATLWRQFGAVDPDLNYVWFTTQLASGSLALNMARNVDPNIQTALLAGRTTDDKTARIKDYQKVNQQLAMDIPYLWLARDTWAVIANPKVQNFANPKTLQGSSAVAFDEGVLWPTQIWVS
jgi:ABC-type transport system substrate-binding protein